MHIPVLLHEVMEGLAPGKGETVLDATLGGAGHAQALAAAVGAKGTLIGIDEDEAAIARGKKALKGWKGKVRLVRGNFRHIEKVLAREKIKSVDCILFDLGVSSFQLDAEDRGFSFRTDSPLRMTLGKKPSGMFTAYDVVNSWDESNLRDIIGAYGEERFAARIARAIVTRRLAAPIETSKELAEIVKRSVPGWYARGRLHPATRTFQAIRIAVNDELLALKEALPQAYRALRRGGRLAVISFHSLEDRIVKQFMRHLAQDGKLALITKKPVVPSSEETGANPRSRSAKLRIAEKIS